MEWWQDFFDEDYVDAWEAAGGLSNTEALMDGVQAMLGLPPGTSREER